MPSPITENRNKDYQLQQSVDERQIFINNGYLHKQSTTNINNRNNCNNIDSNGIAIMDDATGILLEEKNSNGPTKPIIVNFGPTGTTTTRTSSIVTGRTLSIVALCKESKIRNSLLIAAGILIIVGAVIGGLIIYVTSRPECSSGK